nr:RNA polymerase sigma-70 factor [Pedobacter sp. ASV19]
MVKFKEAKERGYIKMMTDYKHHSDEQLITLFKQGDHAAFAEVYNRYFFVIFYKVNQMLRNRQIAEDVVQEIFVRLWAKSELLKADNNLGGYLYISAKNSVLKLIQKDKMKNDYLSSLAKFSNDVSLDTLNELSERELSSILQQEIEKLPTRMRIVFEMSRNENLSHAEIAAKLGITEQTVNKQVSNALKILRTKLTSIAPLATVIIQLAKKD